MQVRLDFSTRQRMESRMQLRVILLDLFKAPTHTKIRQDWKWISIILPEIELLHSPNTTTPHHHHHSNITG